MDWIVESCSFRVVLELKICFFCSRSLLILCRFGVKNLFLLEVATGLGSVHFNSFVKFVDFLNFRMYFVEEFYTNAIVRRTVS